MLTDLGFSSGQVYAGALAVLVLGYLAFLRWDLRKEALREFTHVPDLYNTGGMVRVRTDKEGQARMEAASKEDDYSQTS